MVLINFGYNIDSCMIVLNMFLKHIDSVLVVELYIFIKPIM